MDSSRPVVKIVVEPITHYTGARPIRRTWLAYLEHEDGARTRCGHEQHPTTAAAAACGQKLWKANQ